MTPLWIATTATLVYFVFVPLAQCEEPAKSKPTKEACQMACFLGSTKPKLDGKDKELFNQCADAKYCSDPDTHYYAVEPARSTPSWLWGLISSN